MRASVAIISAALLVLSAVRVAGQVDDQSHRFTGYLEISSAPVDDSQPEYLQEPAGPQRTLLLDIESKDLSGFEEPRVTGSGTLHLTSEMYRNNDQFHDRFSVDWGTFQLENAEGTWIGQLQGAGDSSEGSARWTAWASGEGAYEGLSLVMHLSVIPGLTGRNVVGWVFPGDLPPRP